MKYHANKCQLLVKINNKVNVKIESFDMKNSNSEMFLSVNFDNKLSFTEHISNSCQEASGKDHALVRGDSHIDFLTKYFKMTPLNAICVTPRFLTKSIFF